MRLTRVVVVCGLLAGARWIQSAAQECPDSMADTSAALGTRYAPVLRFAPGERYFPTVPFFQAFETVGGRSGLLDRTRVIPTTGLGKHSPDRDTLSPRVAFDAMDSVYRTQAQEVQPLLFMPAASAVFYRVRCLHGKENKQLWGFLKNDPQAWHRTGLDSMFACGLRNAQFTLVEYWLYYVRDAGLEGHPHDLERVDVLLPRGFQRGVDGTRRICPRVVPNAMLDSVRIVIGTGHSETTPNNILVLLGKSAMQLRNPGYLVELGGHASAPDRNRDAQFQLGLDVNWNISERVWGTRDVQAVSGTGYLGRYSAAMTLPRPEGLSTTLIPDSVSESITDSTIVQQGQGEARGEARGRARGEARPDTGFFPRHYALLPVAPFEELARYLEGSTTVSACAAAQNGDSAFRAAASDSARDVIEHRIVPLLWHRWRSGGFDNASDAAVRQSIEWMRAWVRPQDLRKGEVGTSHFQIWRHADFCGSPVTVLKRRLFRPTGTGIQNFGDVVTLFTLNFGATLGDGGQQLQLGFIVPTIKTKVVIPGILEPQVGLYSARVFEGGPRTVSLSLLYERHYRNTFSWYVRPINYVHNRARYDLDPDAGDFAMGFGISVMPFFPFPNFLLRTADQLRIRAGIRVDLRHWKPDPRRLELQSTFYLR
jgi:hypothetical protein